MIDCTRTGTDRDRRHQLSEPVAGHATSRGVFAGPEPGLCGDRVLQLDRMLRRNAAPNEERGDRTEERRGQVPAGMIQFLIYSKKNVYIYLYMFIRFCRQSFSFKCPKFYEMIKNAGIFC